MPNVPCISFVFLFATVLVISNGNQTEENNVKLSNRSRLFSYEEIKNEVSGECCGPHSNCTVGVNGTECNCYFGFYEVNRTCQRKYKYALNFHINDAFSSLDLPFELIISSLRTCFRIHFRILRICDIFNTKCALI
nr:uncharacterized protein LOC122271455 [Parasteatoda tepidariorum]